MPFESKHIEVIFNYKKNDNQKINKPAFLSQKELDKVRKFHKTIEEYRQSPLVRLNSLAKELGLKDIYVKDESKRILNSFKVLGGSYALSKLICRRLGLKIEDITFNDLKSEGMRKKIGDITFVTCSDGNHGRAVAWTAKELDQKAVIYMPRGTAKKRVEAIRKLSAEVIVTDLNYDDTVRYALEKAKINKWEMVQDTAWEGYEDIPMWIMQGYSTMAIEAIEQLKEIGIKKPTHVLLQAGVGAMAGASLGGFVNLYEDNYPKTIIMEPTEAACMFKSALINDGNPHIVTGNLNSIMAGLACGEPNPLGWKILRDFAHAYCTCPDYVTARGMRILANPLGCDEKIVSGESGAVGIGLLSLLMENRKLEKVKRKLGLNEEAVVLLFSTEGITDPINYRKIVWDGIYPYIKEV